MTREEASRIIKDGIDDMSLDYFDDEQYEALNMAIKALKQEPKTGLYVCLSENTLGRERTMTNQEAINMLKSKMDGHTDTSYEWAETVRMAIKALEEEPKTGYWIKGLHGFKCSKCLIVHSCTSIYCPSCGAKMIE